MNAARRRRLRKIRTQVEELRQAIEFEAEEEAQAADNLEEIGQVDRAEEGREHVDKLEEAVGSLEEVVGILEEAVE